MSANSTQPPPADETIDALIRAKDDRERARLLDSDPRLRGREAVKTLVAIVNRDLRVDLDRAGRTAAALEWLAAQLSDPDSRGLAHRARGNVLIFARDYGGAAAEYETAIRLFARAGNRTEEAISRSAAVGALSQLGDFDRALELAESARRILSDAGDLLRLARLENNLAHLETRRDRFREALGHYESALRHFRTEGQPSDIGISLRNIAVCHQLLDDFPRALAAYGQALDHCRGHDLPLVAAEVEYNIAYLYYLRGDYGQANRLFEQARVASRDLGDLEHEALCDLDQAEIFLELNLVGAAGRLAARAIDGFDELGLEYEAAKATTYRALASFRGGQGDEALALLTRAGERFAAQANRVWQALTELHRAFILFEAGRPAAAADLARAARAVFQEAGLARKSVLCEILLARLALAGGDAERAGRSASSALEQLAELNAPELEFRAHFVAGLAHSAAGRRQEALRSFERSETRLERLRGRLGSEELRIAFLADKAELYEHLVALCLSADDAGGGAEAAFAWAEKGKSRGMADLLASGGFTAPDVEGEVELVGEMKELREEIHWLYRQIDREELRAEGRSPAKLDRLGSEVRRREHRLLDLRRKARARDPDSDWLGEAATADLEKVRAVLPAGSQVLEYFIADGRVLVFLIDRQRLEVRELSTVRRLADLREKLRFQMDRFRMGEDYVRSLGDAPLVATLGSLGRLYDELIRPLEPELTARHLVLVPHDLLHGLPFHAFYDGERHLLDRCSVSYAPSATVLYLCCRRRRAPGDSALVLGVPDERTPAIGDEVAVVASELPSSRLLLGAEATRDRLVRLAPGRRYLHIATHGLHRRDNPIFSAIQLGDGRTSVLDLYGLRLDCELAVLSGCATGLHAVRGADELVGLTRGLLHAGARSVVSSLWDVHDASTARLMGGLYRRLTAGARAAEALRGAAIELRTRRPHPYYWAPFFVTGEPAAGVRGPEEGGR